MSYLTAGCWSPTRPGVFYLTRQDGWLDVWDYYNRQNEVAFTHKVGNSTLTSIMVANGPNYTMQDCNLVAVGDNEGTITLMQLCDSLYEPEQPEKLAIAAMFQREFNREKNLETIQK